MSSNRLNHDVCAYKQNMLENRNQLEYTLDPNKYYSANQCRPSLGIVGGNEVSPVMGNLVDMESNLRGQTQVNTRCPAKKNSWKSSDNTIHVPPVLGKSSLKINTDKYHLPSCDLINYKTMPAVQDESYNMCERPAHSAQFADFSS